MNQELIKLLLDFVKTQKQLIKEFKTVYQGKITDWEYLLDCPKTGYLNVLEENWKFEKHGKGICFISQASGKIIDVHTQLNSHPELLDNWRLIQYFESINKPELVELIQDNGENLIKKFTLMSLTKI
jgi:hypothetical protein